MKWGIVSILATLGCGQVQPPLQADATSASDSKLAGDAAFDAPPAARCNPSAPFGPAVAISELNSNASDEGATLSPDELTVYFDSSRPGGMGGFDIYVATRATRTDPFSAPTLLDGVNSPNNERYPTVTADGLTLYAFNGGSSTEDVVYATRTTPTSSFGSLAPVTGLGSPGENQSSVVLPGGNAMYLTSWRNGTYQPYRAIPAGTAGAMQAPTMITGTDLTAQGNNVDPIVTPDELTLYFASDRTAASGTQNLFVATRTSVAVGFGQPVELTSFNVFPQIAPTWISPDNCVLYFTAGLPGSYRLYAAAKPQQ